MGHGRGRGTRPELTWVNFGDQELAQDISTATAFFGATRSVATVTQTVMRVRGFVGVQLDPATIDESVLLLCGIGIFNEELIAAGGLASAPELFTGLSDAASWIWQGQLYVSSGSLVLGDDTGSLVDRIHVDSKAMRKMKPNEAIAIVFEMPAQLVSDTGGTVDISWYLHCLAAT